MSFKFEFLETQKKHDILYFKFKKLMRLKFELNQEIIYHLSD